MPVFLDDPNAIPMMKKRIADLEKKRTYWKGIKKTVPRPYDRSEGDAITALKAEGVKLHSLVDIEQIINEIPKK